MKSRYTLRSRKANISIIFVPMILVMCGACGFVTWLLASGAWTALINWATSFIQQEPDVIIAQIMATLAGFGILYYCVLPLVAITLFILFIIFVASVWNS